MKIAIHGLGRMGMQIARKLAESGDHQVIAHNRSQEPIDEAVSYGAGCHQQARRRGGLWRRTRGHMGDAADRGCRGRDHRFGHHLNTRGSIMIGGGNSDYRITRELNLKVKQAGKHPDRYRRQWWGMGYQNGFPLMCGSDDRAVYETIVPVLDTLGTAGGMHAHFGPSGRGIMSR